MLKNQIKNFSLEKIKILINECIINYVFISKNIEMPDEIFKMFLNLSLINSLDDYSLLTNKRIRKFIDWNSMPRKKIIRMMTRDISVLDNINFEAQKFSILELENFLKFHPDYINKINVDFSNLTTKEVLILLKIDNQSHHYIDFNKLEFSRLEIQHLVKYFINNEEIINKLDFEKMDNFIYKFIIKKTKGKYLKKINTSKLTVLDWLDIIQTNPSMISICDLNIFLFGDCYYLTKLASISNDKKIYELIKQNKNKISGLGWEKLLILDFKKYSPICNWAALKNGQLKKIKSIYPDAFLI